MVRIWWKYSLGLVKGHYFINGYTELTSYCLEHYGEAKYIKYCDKTYKEFNDKRKKGNDRSIEAFQVLKILADTVDNLIIPMELTEWSIKHTILWQSRRR